jgi:AcrR family transcriptional regulator
MRRNAITKEQVLNTAISIADRNGLKNLALKDIALELGIKTPSLYNHIKGLEDVYNQMALYGLKMLKEAIINSVAGIAGRDALYAAARAYRGFASTYPSLYESTQWVKAWNEDETKREADDIVEILSKILLPFHLSHHESIHVIRTLRSYLHGFSSLEINSSFGLDIDISTSFETGLQLIIEGIPLP